MSGGKKFRIGTSLAKLALVRASRMKIIHVVTVINTTFPVTDKVTYTFIYYSHGEPSLYLGKNEVPIRKSCLSGVMNKKD